MRIITDLKHENRVVIVTGCASGIGRSTVIKYLNEGYTVIGLDRECCEFAGDFFYHKVDLSNEDEVKEIFRILENDKTNICYLINCAGVFFEEQRSLLADMNSKEWNSVMNNNLNSCMYIVKYAISLFGKDNMDNAIVFVSSDQVERPRRRNGAYAVSKGAVNTMAKVCAVELLEKKIRVNVVEAASVRTNFIRKLVSNEEQMNEIYDKENKKMPLGLIEADDVAEIIYFLGSEKAKRITGQRILVDSGLYI